MAVKRSKWLKKRGKRLQLKAKKKKINTLILHLKQEEMDLRAKTVKLKRDEYGRFGHITLLPSYSLKYGYGLPADIKEAVNAINSAGKNGLGWKVKDRLTMRLIGYYLRAEITDIGELWARYCEV